MTTPNPAPVTTTAEDAQEVAAVRAPVAVATSDAERAAFEAWAATQGWKPRLHLVRSRVNGQYAWTALNDAWGVWQAARALPIDFKQATDQGGWLPVPEGCTPADARMLRSANHGLAAENDRLREALQFYADGNHFTMHDANAWDTVSGEPANFYEDEANTATVEDGSVAKMAMALQSEAAPTLLGVADGDAVGGKSGGAA